MLGVGGALFRANCVIRSGRVQPLERARNDFSPALSNVSCCLTPGCAIVVLSRACECKTMSGATGRTNG